MRVKLLKYVFLLLLVISVMFTVFYAVEFASDWNDWKNYSSLSWNTASLQFKLRIIMFSYNEGLTYSLITLYIATAISGIIYHLQKHKNKN